MNQHDALPVDDQAVQEMERIIAEAEATQQATHLRHQSLIDRMRKVVAMSKGAQGSGGPAR